MIKANGPFFAADMTRTMISLAVSSPEEALSQDFDSEDAMTDTSNVD